jgi:hypothetical protein
VSSPENELVTTDTSSAADCSIDENAVENANTISEAVLADELDTACVESEVEDVVLTKLLTASDNSSEINPDELAFVTTLSSVADVCSSEEKELLLLSTIFPSSVDDPIFSEESDDVIESTVELKSTDEDVFVACSVFEEALDNAETSFTRVVTDASKVGAREEIAFSTTFVPATAFVTAAILFEEADICDSLPSVIPKLIVLELRDDVSDDETSAISVTVEDCSDTFTNEFVLTN